MSENTEMYKYKIFVFKSYKQIILVMILSVIVALLAGGYSYLDNKYISGTTMYRSEATYNISYERDSFVEHHDFFNSHAWNDVMDSDIFTDYLSESTGMDKAEIRAMTYVIIPDELLDEDEYSKIVVDVDSENKDEAEIIQKYIGKRLEAFGDEQEYFKSITLGTDQGLQQISSQANVRKAAKYAGCICFVLGFIYVVIRYMLVNKKIQIEDI